MNKLILLVLLGLFSAVAALHAEVLVITTGNPTGSYAKAGSKLQRMLNSGVVRSSNGSIENLEKIMNGEAHIGFCQMDAYASFVNTNADAVNKIEILGKVFEECAYLAVHKDGPIKSEDDLQKEGHTIAVGKKGAGMAVTWDYMRQLEPGYKASKVSYEGGLRAISKLAARPDGDINAVLWLARPLIDDKLATTVVRNRDLQLLDLDDKDLNDRHPATGRPIYRRETVAVKKGLLNGASIKTICVDAVLVADSELEETVLDELSDIVLNYRESLL